MLDILSTGKLDGLVGFKGSINPCRHKVVTGRGCKPRASSRAGGDAMVVSLSWHGKSVVRHGPGAIIKGITEPDCVDVSSPPPLLITSAHPLLSAPQLSDSAKCTLDEPRTLHYGRLKSVSMISGPITQSHNTHSYRVLTQAHHLTR